MSRERDIPGNNDVKQRYLICSSPRVGSNLLCAILRQTQAAGDPLEYINPSYISANYRLAPARPATLTEYLDELESRRTSVNGNFGLKAHHFQLIAACKNDPQQINAFLSRFDKFILMHRKDKLAQAISLDKARKTGFWIEQDREAHKKTGAAPPDVKFDPLHISRALQTVIAEHQSWHRTLASHKKPHISISYEDLSTDANKIGRQVCAYLGFDAPQMPTAAEPLSRQRDEQNNEHYRKFLQYCGLALTHHDV